MVGDAGSLGVFQRAVRRVGQLYRSTLCTVPAFPRLCFIREVKLSSPNIIPLHVKVYILLGRAAFRLRYEEWKQDRKLQAIQAEAGAAKEVEQLRILYQANGSIMQPPEVHL